MCHIAVSFLSYFLSSTGFLTAAGFLATVVGFLAAAGFLATAAGF
jgi:hypothetical protein